jgi:HSP20 family protein
MAEKQGGLVRGSHDPFAVFRQMTSELDRVFDAWPAIVWPRFAGRADTIAWSPKVEVFEKDNQLITRVDLPGMKKEDVTVEVADGQLTLSGERKRSTEEHKDNVYRSECEYGSFYRSIPLPAGVTADSVKASFADGVLEITVTLPPKAKAPVTRVPIADGSKPAGSSAA